MKHLITKETLHTFIRKITRRSILLCKMTEKRITALYTGPHKRQAITISAIAGISCIFALAFVIRHFLPEEPVVQTAYAVSESTECTTLPEATETDATTAETTTVAETTTAETTTNAETTTEAPTNALTVIPISQLDISDEDLSTDKEVLNKQQANSGPSLSSPLGDITAASSDMSPVLKFTLGIDVSKYQGDINWTKVKQDGISFAFIKVAGRGYETGKLYYDSNYKENLREASAAGLKVGAYFFSQATTVAEAREEASLMIDALKNYNITYPVVFDWETAKGYRTYSGIPKATMTAMANTFCEMLEAAGYTAMVYANTFDFERFDAASLTATYASWLARYPENYNGNGVRYKLGDGLPPLEHPYQIWQYSCTGRVNGISGDVDMNVSFVDFSDTSNSYMYFSLPKASYQTSVNQSVDIYKDVKCYDSAGFNSTSSMKCSITDAAGKKISLEKAIQSAGEYTVTYSLTDFTGYTKSKSVPLYVTAPPAIQLHSNLLEISPETTLEELETVLLNNLMSASDGIGNNILSDVVIRYPASYYEEVQIPLQEETTAPAEPDTSQNQSDTSVQETTDSDQTVPETESSSADTGNAAGDSTENGTLTETTTIPTVTVKRLIPGTYTITYEVTDRFGGSTAVTVTLIIKEDSSAYPEESSFFYA